MAHRLLTLGIATIVFVMSCAGLKPDESIPKNPDASLDSSDATKETADVIAPPDTATERQPAPDGRADVEDAAIEDHPIVDERSNSQESSGRDAGVLDASDDGST